MEKVTDTDKDSTIKKIADVVAMLYKDVGLQKFLPALNKGRRRGGKTGGTNISKNAQKANLMDSIFNIYVPYELKDIPGHPKLDAYLKKATTYHFGYKKSSTSNDASDLKKAIDILKAQLAGLARTNTDGSQDEIIKQKTLELEILQKQADDITASELHDSQTDYNSIAVKALKILSKNDETAIELYNLIKKQVVPSESIKTNLPKESTDTDITYAAINSKSWRSSATGDEKIETRFGFEQKYESRGYDNRHSDKSSRGIGKNSGGSSSRTFGGFEPHKFGDSRYKSDKQSYGDKQSYSNRQSYGDRTDRYKHGENSKTSCYVAPHLRQQATIVEEPTYIKTTRKPVMDLDETDFPKLEDDAERRVIIISNEKKENKKLIGAWQVKLSASVVSSAPTKVIKKEIVHVKKHEYDAFGDIITEKQKSSSFTLASQKREDYSDKDHDEYEDRDHDEYEDRDHDEYEDEDGEDKKWTTTEMSYTTEIATSSWATSGWNAENNEW